MLASGEKVSKSNDYVELYGTVDELNSSIGLAISFLNENSELKEPLLETQNLLFELGAELAGYRSEESTGPSIQETDVLYLEHKIDDLLSHLEPMRNFILPGGSQAASFLHMSRTICRNLERLMVRAQESKHEIFEINLSYINRLSDFLFVCGRYANHENQKEDIRWISRNKK